MITSKELNDETKWERKRGKEEQEEMK